MALLNDRPIIVAADLPSAMDVIALAHKLQDAPGVWGLKVHTRHLEAMGGRSLIPAIKDFGLRVFVDRKAHDIPSVVGDMMRAYREWGADMATVHASGGPKMIRAAVEAAGADFGILAVTVLTSLGEDECAAIFGRTPERAVTELAAYIGNNAPPVRGIVCSSQELFPLRQTTAKEIWRDLFRVVPGIRPAGAAANDQKRIGTPGQAITDGATHLVIGRPIYEEGDPKENTARIWEEIRKAAGA